MKAAEAIKKLKRGQMIINPHTKMKTNALRIVWDWDSDSINIAEGYIPIIAHQDLQIVDLPKPRVEAHTAVQAIIERMGGEKSPSDIAKAIMNRLAMDDVEWNKDKLI